MAQAFLTESQSFQSHRIALEPLNALRILQLVNATIRHLANVLPDQLCYHDREKRGMG